MDHARAVLLEHHVVDNFFGGATFAPGDRGDTVLRRLIVARRIVDRVHVLKSIQEIEATIMTPDGGLVKNLLADLWTSQIRYALFQRPVRYLLTRRMQGERVERHGHT